VQETEWWCANVSTDTVHTSSFITQSSETHANRILCLPTFNAVLFFRAKQSAKISFKLFL